MDELHVDPFELSGMNAETILNGGKDYSPTPDQQMLGFLRQHDPTTTVPPSQSPVNTVEQNLVPSNVPLPDSSELGHGHFPENISGGSAPNAGERLLSSEQNPVTLTTPPLVTKKSGHDLKVSPAIRRRRKRTRTAPPTEQGPEIVPQVPETPAAPPQQRQKTDPCQQKKLDTELRLNLKTITEQAGKGVDDVKRQVEGYADMSSKPLLDMLESKNKAKLEGGDKKARRAALSNINQRMLRRKQYLSIHGLTVTVELLFIGKEKMHVEKQCLLQKVETVETERQSLMAEVELLKAEVRRLKGQQSDSSSADPPHDNPPSGGPPSNDFGGNDPGPDNSKSGGPGFSSGSSDGPTMRGGPSSGGEPPCASLSNAQLLPDVSEDCSDYSSQESSSDEESNDDTGCRQRVDEALLTEYMSSDSRDMNEEDYPESALSWSSLSELDSGSEHESEPCTCTITEHPAINLNAQESVGSARLKHCSTPVNDVLPCKCQAVGRAQSPDFLSIDSCDDMPALVLPYSLSETKVL